MTWRAAWEWPLASASRPDVRIPAPPFHRRPHAMVDGSPWQQNYDCWPRRRLMPAKNWKEEKQSSILSSPAVIVQPEDIQRTTVIAHIPFPDSRLVGGGGSVALDATVLEYWHMFLPVALQAERI